MEYLFLRLSLILILPRGAGHAPPRRRSRPLHGPGTPVPLVTPTSWPWDVGNEENDKNNNGVLVFTTVFSIRVNANAPSLAVLVTPPRGAGHAPFMAPVTPLTLPVTPTPRPQDVENDKNTNDVFVFKTASSIRVNVMPLAPSATPLVPPATPLAPPATPIPWPQDVMNKNPAARRTLGRQSLVVGSNLHLDDDTDLKRHEQQQPQERPQKSKHRGSHLHRTTTISYAIYFRKT